MTGNEAVFLATGIVAGLFLIVWMTKDSKR